MPSRYPRAFAFPMTGRKLAFPVDGRKDPNANSWRSGEKAPGLSSGNPLADSSGVPQMCEQRIAGREMIRAAGLRPRIMAGEACPLVKAPIVSGARWRTV